MLYLYLGYLVTQLYTFVNVLAGIRFVWSVHVFSTIVFLAFTFIPVVGYLLAKHLGASGQSNRYVLLLIGLTIGLLEKGLYQIGGFSIEYSNAGVASAFVLMFFSAFIPFDRRNEQKIRK